MRGRSWVSCFAGVSATALLGGAGSLPARAMDAAPPALQQSAALSAPADHPPAVGAPSSFGPTDSKATPFDFDAALPPAKNKEPALRPELRSAPWSPAAPQPATSPVPAPTPVATATPVQSAPAAMTPVPVNPAQAAPVLSAKPSAKPKAEDKGLDPEPDVAITPPPVADPVQAPLAKPVDAAKASPPDEPLPPINAAIKKALDRRDAIDIKGSHAAERRKQREAMDFFYAAHSFAPIWSADGVPAASVEPVIARLAHASDDALTLSAAPASLTVNGTLDAIAESELDLSEAVVSFARQATGSRIEPRTIAPLIGFKPDLADATEALEAVASAGAEAGDRLEAFNPAEPRYVALREKLMEMRAAHTPVSASTIPAGPDLKVGMSDPRVPLIRARFSLDGTPDGVPQNLRYDTEVAAAVADFQRANGIPASGVLTKRTIAALSGGQPSRLEGELVANMEMWRWMPRDLGANRIEVNVPNFTVTVFKDGAAVSQNRVVVGKTNTPTPLFSNAMKFLIVNPVWNVPDSIIKKEMIPKLSDDPSYLERLGYDVSRHNGRLVVKQPAGAKNALGRIKFMFPNDYAVYLHDTPSKSLFASTKRAFSHGCVRVDQPFRFAESVLGTDKGWSQKRLEGMLGNSERYVNLPVPLPIHIEYFTAFVDESGHLDLRDDVYDYVHKVALALGQEG